MYFYKYKKLMRNLGQGVVMPKVGQIQAKNRLLAAIRGSAEWQQTIFYTEPQLNWAQKLSLAKALQPIGVFILVLVLTLSGSLIAAVVVAKGSLPGDTLYGVKITVEKAQLSLVFSQAKQAELEMSFASSRLDEVNKLIDQQDGESSQVAANVGRAMAHFSSSLGSVQKKLDSAKTQVDQKNAKSLAVTVAKAGSEESLVKLQGKIATIEKKIDQITINEAALKEAKAVLGQPATANPEGLSIIKESAKNSAEKAQNLEDAKNILASQDLAKFRDILVKVEQTKALVQATKETIDSILDKK